MTPITLGLGAMVKQILKSLSKSDLVFALMNHDKPFK